MPEEFRERAFKPDRYRVATKQARKVLKNEEHTAYQIARDHLDELNAELLEVVYLLIKDN